MSTGYMKSPTNSKFVDGKPAIADAGDGWQPAGADRVGCTFLIRVRVVPPTHKQRLADILQEILSRVVYGRLADFFLRRRLWAS